jgi:hypothetical protein
MNQSVRYFFARQEREYANNQRRFETNMGKRRNRVMKGQPRPIPGIDAPYRDGTKPRPPKERPADGRHAEVQPLR